MTPEFELKEQYSIDELLEIMAFLRSDEGCAWDRAQNHESIRKNVLEEAYEVVETIDNNDMEGLCEELGDLLMQVVFHAQMAKEAGTFEFNDVVTGICRKLIRRHTHLFGADRAETPDAVLNNWEKNKQKERAARNYQSRLDDVPKTLPALTRSFKIQQKASRAGFDWPEATGALAKVHEELAEIEACFNQSDSNLNERVEEEVGDLLFAVVNYSRLLKVDPETALMRAAGKFARRFRQIEKTVSRQGSELEQLSLEELDTIWDQVKEQERKNDP